ncbi:MAG: flagellar hook-basal body complex protein FliE [Clostridia bacterium]|nr:flagellar hook-basal body complex protein FliE [Clostridia bacterium]
MLSAPNSLLMPTSVNNIETEKSKLESQSQKGTSFGDVLQKKINELNKLQIEADKLTQDYLAGNVTDVHQVMLALEKANLSLQLAMQVRNKVVEAYQEISHMQI